MPPKEPDNSDLRPSRGRGDRSKPSRVIRRLVVWYRRNPTVNTLVGTASALVDTANATAGATASIAGSVADTASNAAGSVAGAATS
ncbi:MAG: phosphate acyltransferase PlsX, partial [Synechococcus sp. ELA057]